MIHSVSTTGRYRSVPVSVRVYALANGVESAVDPSRKPAFGISSAQQLCAHHRRQRQRDDARHDDRAGQRERELSKQRASQPALDADGRIHGGERDGHGDNRTDELASGFNRRPIGALAFVQVPFDVLDHHDRVIDDQADREHDRKQRKQVDRESGHHHEKHGTHERDGNGDDRNNDGTERSEEQEDDEDDDQQRLG